MEVRRRKGSEPLLGTDGASLEDFWSWSYSTPLVNIERGVVAEFLTAHALGIAGGVRVPWDAYDLWYRDQPLEVKSSAYVQAWPQPRPTLPTFSIREARENLQDAAGNWIMSQELRRHAAAYIFALFAEQDRNRASESVLDASCWQFYVLPTSRIDAELGGQKTLRLGTLQNMVDPVNYRSLKTAVDKALPSK
jgi:hypothetical protein